MLVKDLKEFLKYKSEDTHIYFEDIHSDVSDCYYHIEDIYIDDDGDIILKNK